MRVLILGDKMEISSSSSLPKYPDYIDQIITSEKGQPLPQKSRLFYHTLNWLSPAIGEFYLTSDSIFWNGPNYLTIAEALVFDGLCIYSIIKDRQYFSLIPMVALRLTFSIVSDVFITYDNNILGLGYKIKF
ncbi:MAG: hypothetical protein A4E71_00015 [Smithella sp. PtaU1.Bin162]|nr:MAG: hypothetical protein A4E71_00015 [Smithella sp. PtaU1.Bin162]